MDSKESNKIIEEQENEISETAPEEQKLAEDLSAETQDSEVTEEKQMEDQTEDRAETKTETEFETEPKPDEMEDNEVTKKGPENEEELTSGNSEKDENIEKKKAVKPLNINLEDFKKNAWLKWFFGAIALVLILLLLNAIALKTPGKNTGTTPKNDGSTKTETKAVQFKSTDGKLTGVIGLRPFSQNPRFVQAIYNIKITDDLAENWACKFSDPKLCTKSTEYSYGINLKQSGQDPNEGSISSVQCQKNWVFDNPYADSSSTYEFAKCFQAMPVEKRVTQPTNVFYAWFTKTYDNYDDFKSNKTIELYDLQKYWFMGEKTADSETWSVDVQKAMLETQPVRTYELEFEQ